MVLFHLKLWYNLVCYEKRTSIQYIRIPPGTSITLVNKYCIQGYAPIQPNNGRKHVLVTREGCVSTCERVGEGEREIESWNENVKKEKERVGGKPWRHPFPLPPYFPP